MAKASGPALFDLLDQEQVRTPREIDPRRAVSRVGAGELTQQATIARGSGDRSAAIGHERPLVLRGGGRQPEQTSEVAGREDRSKKTPPLVEVDDDRVRFTLTSTRTAVVVFVLLVGLLAAFEFGRSRGHRGGFAQGFNAGRDSFASQTLSEIEVARSAPPSTDVVSSLLVGSASTSGAPVRTSRAANAQDRTGTRPVQWISGHTYIVAQGFQRGREADAIRAQEFLASRGIETELVRYDSGAMQLITTRGFNRSDPAQRSLADQWLTKVHSAGEAYFASGGGYRLDGYFATFTGDRW